MDITSPENTAMEELEELAGEVLLVVAVPTIASSPVTAPANMAVAANDDSTPPMEAPANFAVTTDDFDVSTEDVCTEDVSTLTTAPVDVGMGCDCQQCLYARENSGLCCCYHCLRERDQSRQRDTSVATTPEIPPVSVATNMDHQQEVACWEV
jgi:hypothetical protein